MYSSQKIDSLNFCAIDLETTGVNPAFNKIIEIGVVKFNFNGDFKTFYSLVNPGVSIPESVIRIHGITDSMVENSPHIDELLHDFYDFIKDSILVVHNPRFDLSFLDRAFKNGSMDHKEFWALDTVRLAKKYFTDIPNHKLPTLAQYLNIHCQNHRALDDAMVCMRVFLEVAKGSGLSGSSTFGDLMRLHGDRVYPGIVSDCTGKINPIKKISIGRRVTIKYMDSDGNITCRNILPKEFIKYGKKKYLLAHCYLRDSERCFMTSRIIGVE